MGRSFRLKVPKADRPVKVKRLAGRLRGATGEVVNPTRSLGVHNFAYVRAGMAGIDPCAAFERYLARGDTTLDPRHVEHRQAEILRQVFDAGRATDATLEPERKITWLLNALP